MYETTAENLFGSAQLAAQVFAHWCTAFDIEEKEHNGELIKVYKRLPQAIMTRHNQTTGFERILVRPSRPEEILFNRITEDMGIGDYEF